MARKVYPIDQGWSFKQADDVSFEFLPVAQFPTNVHLDLLHHGLIPDPNTGKNENAVQWVGEKSWLYRTTFQNPELSTGKAVLAFDGLDTHATVRLNGVTILKTEDMFIPERVDITNSLSTDDDKLNVLEISFDSTYLIGKKLVEKYPDHYWGCWNGDPSRLAVRKAQYHYVLHPRRLLGTVATDHSRVGIGVLLCSLVALGDQSLWKRILLVYQTFPLPPTCANR